MPPRPLLRIISTFMFWRLNWSCGGQRPRYRRLEPNVKAQSVLRVLVKWRWFKRRFHESNAAGSVRPDIFYGHPSRTKNNVPSWSAKNGWTDSMVRVRVRVHEFFWRLIVRSKREFP